MLSHARHAPPFIICVLGADGAPESFVDKLKDGARWIVPPQRATLDDRTAIDITVPDFGSKEHDACTRYTEAYEGRLPFVVDMVVFSGRGKRNTIGEWIKVYEAARKAREESRMPSWAKSVGATAFVLNQKRVSTL